jgi:hypothetical protein
MLNIAIKNNLYLTQKYLIIPVNKFNPKPINHKITNRETYDRIELSIIIVLDKNNIETMNGKNIKLNPENSSLTKI